MAQVQYDVLNGQDQGYEITKGAGGAIGGSAVRVTVDDAVASNKFAIIKALEAVKQRVLSENLP